MLASAEVVIPISAMPESTPNPPAATNMQTLALSSAQPARPTASGLPPTPRTIAPYEERMTNRCTTIAIITAATTGNGTTGGFRLMNQSSQSGAFPPGLG